jgi:lipopolysaccharide exporter
VPGLALAMLMDRIAFMPERILNRDLRFRPLAIAKSLAEAALPFVAVATAALGAGGMAIVYGNIARSAVNLGIVVASVDRRDWLEVGPIDGATLRLLGGYGFVVAIGAFMTMAARKWDNLIVSRLQGDWIMGNYNLAYNLADIPALQVGTQITDVLLASLANIEAERRRQAMLKATGLIALLMFPLSIGLGLVAPTIVHTFLDRRWALVAPMLVVLAAMSITRPIANAVQSYMMVGNQTRAVALLESLNIALIVIGLYTFGRSGPIAACAAVGVAFFVRLLVTLALVRVAEGLPMMAVLGSCVRPLAACVPMAAAVYAVHIGLGQLWDEPTKLTGVAQLGLEIATGVVVFAGAAWLVAREPSRQLLELGRKLRERRSA